MFDFAFNRNNRESEKRAADYLDRHFGGKNISFPIDPFQLLQKEKVLLTFANFNDLEGVYLPSSSQKDVPLVGINARRPITRQRFTAAHELYHHLYDSDKQYSCPIGSKNKNEKDADAFAAAILMPYEEFQSIIDERKDAFGHITFDDVLFFADYFGVSFEACLFRAAYLFNVIDGDLKSSNLRKRIRNYKPEKKREEYNLSYLKLYEQLLDDLAGSSTFKPNLFAQLKFQNEYIYNDSRMEGLDVTIEQASEIVTDLRMNMQNSEFCIEENEAYLSIAGHYEMYKDIFAYSGNYVGVVDLFRLNKKLFSYYPYPEFGGTIRKSNTLVMGGKFETIDCTNIYDELGKLNDEFLNAESFLHEKELIKYVKKIVQIHYKLTVIHPFADGNGRTARALMNMQFIHAGLPPIYIFAEEKNEYYDALRKIDIESDYSDLYILVIQKMIASIIELYR